VTVGDAYGRDDWKLGGERSEESPVQKLQGGWL